MVIVLDQITKYFSVIYLSTFEPLNVMPGFNLVLAYNKGAAFSMLAGAGGWQRWFFLILTVFVCIVLATWLYKLERDKKTEAMAIALIFGGAIGNFIDRLIDGSVVDFIDIYVSQYHWPAFNIADTAITIGAVILIWLTIITQKA